MEKRMYAGGFAARRMVCQVEPPGESGCTQGWILSLVDPLGGATCGKADVRRETSLANRPAGGRATPGKAHVGTHREHVVSAGPCSTAPSRKEDGYVDSTT